MTICGSYKGGLPAIMLHAAPGVPGLKVGQLDDPDNVGHFLMGQVTTQVGLIHKLNYLDVTRIFSTLGVC